MEIRENNFDFRSYDMKLKNRQSLDETLPAEVGWWFLTRLRLCRDRSRDFYQGSHN